MNSVVLIGRLTADPQLRYLPNGGRAVCNFSLAVDNTEFLEWGDKKEGNTTSHNDNEFTGQGFDPVDEDDIPF